MISFASPVPPMFHKSITISELTKAGFSDDSLGPAYMRKEASRMEMKNLIRGLQHVGIPTRHLDKTVAFYQSLGFVLVHDTENPRDHGRVVFLRLHGVTIEAWQSEESCGGTGAINHIALDVTDVEKVFDYVKAHVDCRFLTDAPQFLPYWEKGVRFFTIEGPNEERVEFSQYV